MSEHEARISDEQIEGEVWECRCVMENDGRKPTSLQLYRVVSDAQLRKVVEWLYGECGVYEHGMAPKRKRYLCHKCRQSVKEAVQS